MQKFEFNYYILLEVDFNADISEIKSSYRKLSKKCHPDIGGEVEKQRRLNDAYETLSDPVARNNHDRYWKQSTPHFFEKTNQKTNYQNNSQFHKSGGSKTTENNKKTIYRSNKPIHATNKYQSSIYNNFSESMDKLKTDILNDYNSRRTSIMFHFGEVRSEIIKSKVLSAFVFIGSISIAFLIENFLPLIISGFSLLFLLSNQRRSYMGYDFSFADLKREELESLVDRFIESKVSIELKRKRDLWESVCQYFNSEYFSFSSSSSEKSMAILLLLGFFSIGYKPISFYSYDRTITFEDEDGLIIVRYRHRDGNPTNINYVRDLIAKRNISKSVYGRYAKKAYIFSSPGFSDNAMEECRKEKIRYYNFVDFQEWLVDLRNGSFSGPHDNIFDSLEMLQRIMQQVYY